VGAEAVVGAVGFRGAAVAETVVVAFGGAWLVVVDGLGGAAGCAARLCVTKKTTSAVRRPGPISRSHIVVTSPSQTTMLVVPVSDSGWSTTSKTSEPRCTGAAATMRGSPIATVSIRRSARTISAKPGCR
jgi:hypothetical protein